MKIKTTELQREALDRMVAKAEGIELSNGCYNRLLIDGRMSAGQKMLTPYNPSTDWSQGGPIIERERIATWFEPITRTRMLVCRAGLLPNIVSVSTQGQPL
jgi:hypothetical protein